MAPIIDIIVPTYKRKNFLQLLIQSFLVQTYKNWKLSVVIDGKDDESIALVKSYDTEQISAVMLFDGPHNDWGHMAREYGLKNSKSDWLIMTGDDNYYVPTFIEYITDSIIKTPSAIVHYYNFVSGSTNTKLYPLPINYYLADAKLERGQIDIGSFVTKTSNAKQIGFPFRAYDGDFDYLSAYLKLFGKMVITTSGKLEYSNVKKINKYLQVHN